MTDHAASSDRKPPPPAPPDLEAMRTFIRTNTRLAPVAGLDFVRHGERRQIQVWQADEITPIWTATEADLERQGLEPPFWAFPWAGGQAVARLILARPDLVAGKRVLDIAAGGGLIAVAAALAGAAEVLANDIDRLCEAAVSLNAEANAVTIGWRGGNLLDAPLPGVDVILAGDIFYQKQMAERFLAWLAAAKAQGTQVYVGDPGRAYAPKDGILPLAEYDITTNLDLEGVSMRRARVWAL
jgi:predicted nicotinamide N-methyase